MRFRKPLEHLLVEWFDETLRVGEEWDLTLRLALAGCPMDCIKDPLAMVCLQEDSLTRSIHLYEGRSPYVLLKIYSMPSFPENLRPMQPDLLAHNYLRNAAAAYMAGSDKGFELLMQAFEVCPGILHARTSEFSRRLVIVSQ